MLSVSLSRKMNFLLLLKKHFLSRLHDFVSVEPIFGPCFGSDLRVRFFTDAFGSCFTCASLASGRSFSWPLFPGSSLGVTACARGFSRFPTLLVVSGVSTTYFEVCWRAYQHFL